VSCNSTRPGVETRHGSDSEFNYTKTISLKPAEVIILLDKKSIRPTAKNIEPNVKSIKPFVERMGPA
jgi:hypothetical protein